MASREIDYDKCYASLCLQPGTPLKEIEAAWKKIARSVHPDNFIDGPMKEKGTRRLQEINNARDHLRDYWRKHDKAPPRSKKHEQFSKAQADARSEDKNAAARSGGAASTGAGPAPERNSESAPESDENVQFRRYAKPFGPPPLKKSWNHHVYDFMYYSHGDAALLAVPLWFAVWLGPFVLAGFLAGVLFVVWPQEPLLAGMVFWGFALGLGIPFWRMFAADLDIYLIQRNPFLQALPTSASELSGRITKIIESSSFAGHKWTLAGREAGESLQFRSNDYVMSFAEGDRKYRLRLYTRLMESDSGDSSVLSYWFEVDAAVDWRIPVARVMKATDKALRGVLQK